MTPNANRAAAKVQGYRIIASSLVCYQSPDQVEQRLVLRTVGAVPEEFADFDEEVRPPELAFG
jgi:hypothetical protein